MDKIFSSDKLIIYGAETQSTLGLPFADEGVRAGFPSPAQEYMESTIDLNRDLVHNPESTFYARVAGDSMVEAGLNPGDILVVDRSIEAMNGDIAVCVLNGEFTVKKLELKAHHIALQPANPSYSPIIVAEADQFSIWGVVTYVIKPTRKRHS